MSEPAPGRWRWDEVKEVFFDGETYLSDSEVCAQLNALQAERDRLRETLVQIRIAHSKHHALTVDALLTAALGAAQKAHEPATPHDPESSGR